MQAAIKSMSQVTRKNEMRFQIGVIDPIKTWSSVMSLKLGLLGTHAETAELVRFFCSAISDGMSSDRFVFSLSFLDLLL